MLISIAADAHDHYQNLAKMIKTSNEKGCELLLFAGDLGAPGNSFQVLETFKGKIILVKGNNDGEMVGIMRNVAKRADQMELAKTYLAGNTYEGEYDGVKIFMHHRPRIAELAAKSGEFDLCICGHTHTYLEERVGNTWLINPSSLHPYKAEASFVVFDTKTSQALRVLL